MPDTQQMIETIRAALTPDDAGRSGSMADLAASYAQACAEANARLRRCVEFVRLGLRSEAIQLAETPPNLLEMTAALDFPERKQWEFLCQANHFPLAQPLRVEAAQELNESYAAEATLRDTLVRHRRLALARAPLRERAAVLRELVRRDPSNGRWAQDVRSFESVRVVELRDEAAAAIKSHDGARAVALLHELHDEGWSTPVPDTLHAALEGEASIYLAAQALEKMRALLPQLERAVDGQNYELAAPMAAEWKKLGERVNGEAPSAIAERAQPALEWVAQQAQRRRQARLAEAAAGPLREALLAQAPTQTLEALHRDAIAQAGALPSQVSTLYARTMAARQRVVRGARLRVLGIVGTVALAIGIVVAVVVWQNMRERREQRWLAQLTGAVEAGNWADATDLWQDITARQPELADRPKFADLKARVDAALNAERDRVTKFARHLDAATAPGAQARAISELDMADEAARTPAEHVQVADLRTRVTAAAAKRRADAESAFRGQVEFLTTEAAALDATLLDADPDAFARRLDADTAAAGKLKVLLTDGSLGDADAKAATAVADRLAAARQMLTLASAERAQLDVLRHSIGSVADWVAALKTYILRFPDSTRTKSFNTALVQAPAWEAVEAWGKLVNGWTGVMTPTSLTDAEQRLALVSDYLREHPVSPLAGDVQNYANYLTQFRDASAAGAPWRQKIAQLMESPLIQNVASVRTARGVYYTKYVGEDPLKGIKHTSLGSTFAAILSNDVSQPTNVTVKDAEVITPPGPSPQTLLAKAVLEQLQQPDREHWETAPLAVAAMVREQKDLDPVLRVVMLSEVLKAAPAGGWRLEEPLKDTMATLAAVHAEDVVWVNPTNSIAQTARPTAVSALATLPPLPDIAAQVTTRRDQMFAALRFTVAGEGALFHAGSAWRLDTRDAIQAGQEAVIVAGSDPMHPELWSIGKVHGARWMLEDDKLKGTPEGTLVFIRPPAAH